MSRKVLIKMSNVVTMIMVVLLLTGCNRGAGRIPIGELQLKWSGYTMGIEQITDDQEMIASSSIEYSGQLIKVCFRHIEDVHGAGGFELSRLFDYMKSDPITLRDKNGNIYTDTKVIGDIRLTITANGLSTNSPMPRFSITFDVPLDTKVVDYVMICGGEEYALEEFISDAYAAERAK